jgi:hypothetical protein
VVGRIAIAGVWGVVALGLAGCGAVADAERGSAPAKVVDERHGTFEGFRVGATSKAIRARFGTPLKSPDRAITPPDVDYYEVGGPTSFRPPPTLYQPGHPGGSLRYHGRAWLVEGSRLYGFMTVERGARTRAGVAIGDPSKRVTERYEHATCETANEGTEYVTFPLCEVLLRPGVRLYFGGEPVKSIWFVVSADRAYRDLAAKR